MVFSSGTPFNVTVPLDLLGTSILNDRPAFVFSGNMRRRSAGCRNQ